MNREFTFDKVLRKYGVNGDFDSKDPTIKNFLDGNSISSLSVSTQHGEIEYHATLADKNEMPVVKSSFEKFLKGAKIPYDFRISKVRSGSKNFDYVVEINVKKGSLNWAFFLY